jgi:hypothetical protein
MQYINYTTYSDTHPFVVISITGKTAIVRRMICERTNDNEWVAGGFAGHCTNQDDQQWSCVSDPTSETRQMTLRKDGCWRFVGEPTVRGGCRGHLRDHPVKFYDYNF